MCVNVDFPDAPPRGKCEGIGTAVRPALCREQWVEEPWYPTELGIRKKLTTRTPET